MEVFHGKKDIYGGVLIKSDQIQWNSCKDFAKKLKKSLTQWHEEGVRGVWIQIFLKDASLVGEVAKHDFQFHHTQPQYVMMTKWLPNQEPNMLPSFANHYIGVGGLVLNDKNQILVIKERYTPMPLWKLPGGAVDTDEYPSEAVIREVLEETGIKTTFKSIACIRHLQQFRFSQSDFYFVCLLQPLTRNINFCKAEIADCRWMDIEDFLSCEFVAEGNKMFVRIGKEQISLEKSITPERLGTNCEVYSIS